MNMDILAAWKMLLTMRIQIDMHNKNGTRPPKDLAILYKRMMITADEVVIPSMKEQGASKEKILQLQGHVTIAGVKLD